MKEHYVDNLFHKKKEMNFSLTFRYLIIKCLCLSLSPMEMTISNSFFFLSPANSEQLSSSVTADTVKSYLGEHPEFLDTYIQQNVNPDTIEQWISRRPQTPSQVPTSRKTSATIHPILPPPTTTTTPPPRPSSSLSSASTKNNLSTSKPKPPSSATTGNETFSLETNEKIYHHRLVIFYQCLSMIYDQISVFVIMRKNFSLVFISSCNNHFII